MNKNELQAETAADKCTAADSIPPTSLVQNGLLADVLSVQEAIQAMYDGKKVTHRFLTQEKFMKLTDTLYEFADGRKCDPVLFWELRGLHNEWLTGWSLHVG